MSCCKRVLVVAHHPMEGVETKPVQFGLGQQSELPHGYEAGDRRCSTELVESPLYLLSPLMDEFIQLQVAVVKGQGLVVAQGSALVQDSVAESVECDDSNLLEHPPIWLRNSHLMSSSYKLLSPS